VSVHVMAPIMRDLTYDGKKKLILLAIADMVDHDGVGFASYAQIQRVTNVSTTYLTQTIREFVEDGRLEIMSKGNGPGRATVYRVVMDWQLSNSVAQNDETELSNSVAQNYPTMTANYPTPSPSPPSITSVPNTSVHTARVRKPVDDPPDFAEFWLAYPRKADKGHARRAWSKATNKTTANVIIAAAERYRDDPNREPEYTALPATWLNGERWLDDPLPSRDNRHDRKTSDVQSVIERAAARDAQEITG